VSTVDIDGARLTALDRLSYRPAVVRLARQLPGHSLLSRLYYRWKRPAGGMLRIDIGGASCAFELRAHWQLRWLEGLAFNPARDPDLQALLATVRRGDVVYDIGANMGVFTVALAKRVGASGTVVAFEPQAAAFDHLESNVRLNALGNVRAYRLGVGEHDEEAVVEPAREDVLSRLTPVAAAIGRAAVATVSIVNGDRFRAEHGLPAPTAVKIDVQGYEDAVIGGLSGTLSAPACRLVCCEIHPPLLPKGVSELGVLARLRSLGFQRVALHRFDIRSVAVCEKP
jgi:FkbM family methyltransferase